MTAVDRPLAGERCGGGDSQAAAQFAKSGRRAEAWGPARPPGAMEGERVHLPVHISRSDPGAPARCLGPSDAFAPCNV